MPNILDANGLQVASLSEVTAALVADYQGIYGADVNVGPNSPDGQVIGIFAQNVVDILGLLLQVYNSFNPDSAFGTTLDARCAINGVTRKAGTFTLAYVQVTVNQARTLTGLDTATPANPAYAVQDDTGNQFQLVTHYAFAGAGTASLAFQAAAIGQVQTLPNTITAQATVVQGVTAVNNPPVDISTTGTVSMGLPQVTAIPSTAGMVPGLSFEGNNIPVGALILSVDSAHQVTLTQNATGGSVGEAVTAENVPDVEGLPEETDPQLKIRRSNSLALAAVGRPDAIRGQLLAIADVSDAYVVENFTGAPVAGVPAHSVWIIVGGGTAPEIGTAIYKTKNDGCGMLGAQSYAVPRPQGNTFLAKWDNRIGQPLSVRATLNPRVAGQTFDVVADGLKLAAALVYRLGQSPNIGDVVAAMATIEAGAVLSTVNVSKDGGATWEDIVTPDTAQKYFTLAAGNVALSNA